MKRAGLRAFESCYMAEKERLLELSCEWTGKDLLGKARFPEEEGRKRGLILSEDERCWPSLGAPFSFSWEESLVQGHHSW